MKRLAFLIASFCFILAVQAFAEQSAMEGRRRFLWVGEISGHNEIFLDMIPTDPRFVLAGTVPCDLQQVTYEDAIRFTRIYLPRKYSDLVSYHDGLLFHDFTPKVLTEKRIEWFRQAVEEGLGLCLVEFAFRAAPWCGMGYWPETTLYDAFPADLMFNQIEAVHGRQIYEVVVEGPIVDFPDMENIIINWGAHGDLVARDGATVWAIWKGRRKPALVSREYGQGTVLHYDHGWDTMPWDVKRSWRYLPDYIFAHLSFITGLPFPDDLELIHEIRAMFSTFKEQIRMAISVIEFIDKFGANPREFEERLALMGETKSRAEALYIEGDMSGAAESMRESNERIRQISNDMMRAKNRAMFWIFVSEWLVVTATFMVCGFVLWTVMVRRRLYREVRSTRLGHR